MPNLESKTKDNLQNQNSNSIKLSSHSIRVIAESVGVSNLADEAVKHIATKVSQGLLRIVQDSAKFMHHSKRDILRTVDVDHAMKLHNMDPLYGYLDGEEKPFRPVYNGKQLYFMEEKELNIDDIIDESIKKLKVPLEPTIYPYWLAKRKNDISVENILENSYEVLVTNNPKDMKPSAEEKPIDSTLTLNHLRNHSWQTVAVKNLTIDDISSEMQIYYKELTEACVGSDEAKRAEALRSLASYTGLHEMMPRISTFIMEGVKINIVDQNLALLIYLMRMVKALLENRSIFIKEYLHEMIPSILSCIVSKELCVRPDYDNHWALRNFASRLIAQICRLYNNSINKIQDRVVAILDKPFHFNPIYLNCIYGSVSGFTELGSEMIKTFVLPHLKELSDVIDTNAYAPSSHAIADKMTIDKLKSHLRVNCSPVVMQIRSSTEVAADYVRDYGSLGALIYEYVQYIKNPSLQIQKFPQITEKATNPSTTQSPTNPKNITKIPSTKTNISNTDSSTKIKPGSGSLVQIKVSPPKVNSLGSVSLLNTLKLSPLVPEKNVPNRYETSETKAEAANPKKSLSTPRPTVLSKESLETPPNLSFENVFADPSDPFCEFLVDNGDDSIGSSITVTTYDADNDLQGNPTYQDNFY